MSKAKVKPWCQCPAPRPFLGANGEILVATPTCLDCGFSIKRRPKPGQIQAQSPHAAHVGPDPCPRPPELAIEVGLRGAAQGRRERRGFIATAQAIVTQGLDDDDREPERVLRRFLLERAQDAERRDPPPAEDLIAPQAPISAPAGPSPRALAIARARAAAAAIRYSTKERENTP